MLLKLALHYPRSNLAPSQFKHLIADYVDDLHGFAVADIENAINSYRHSDKTFFPNVGQLITIIRTPPSWDIRSQKEHNEILREAAGNELKTISTQIEMAKVSALANRSQAALLEHKP